jgi:transposase
METITMSVAEQRRAWILTRVLKGTLTMAEAGEALGLSERHLWRLRAAFEREGPAGLVHGNRGRSSARRMPAETRARIVELRQGRYARLNDSHFTDLLAEREGILVSRETVRTILRAEGIASPRRRRPPRHRRRRPRMAAEGTLLQLDGSQHDWLEERGPRLSLLGAIDDATGMVPAALFREQEDAAGYLMLLHAIVISKGLPEAVYRDGHGAFAPTGRPGDGDDVPWAEVALSQVGRALVELGIGSITARSAQAKGRIERLWGTFQDRLVAELRLAGIADLADANAFLPGFLVRFNARFGVPAGDPEPAWRPLPAELDPGRVLVFKYLRKVAKDHTIRLDGRVLQLPRWGTGAGYAGKRVEVHVRLDGSIVAFDGEHELAALPAPADPVQLRALPALRAGPGLAPAPATMPWIPPADHPWKRMTSDRRRKAATDRITRQMT